MKRKRERETEIKRSERNRERENEIKRRGNNEGNIARGKKEGDGDPRREKESHKTSLYSGYRIISLINGGNHPTGPTADRRPTGEGGLRCAGSLSYFPLIYPPFSSREGVVFRLFGVWGSGGVIFRSFFRLFFFFFFMISV